MLEGSWWVAIIHTAAVLCIIFYRTDKRQRMVVVVVVVRVAAHQQQHVVIITLTIPLCSFNSPAHFQLFIGAWVATKLSQIDGITRTFIVHKSTNVPFVIKCLRVVIIWKPIVKLNTLTKKIFSIAILYICDQP